MKSGTLFFRGLSPGERKVVAVFKLINPTEEPVQIVLLQVKLKKNKQQQYLWSEW